MKKQIAAFGLALMAMAFLPVSADTELCTEHKWGDWQIEMEATCGDEGEEVRYCIVCDEPDYQTIPATGKHQWSKWEIDEKPDCVHSGLKYKECDTCGEYAEQKIPATRKHLWSKWKVSKKATALKKGQKTSSCKTCGKKKNAAIKKLKGKVSLQKKTITLKKKNSCVLKIKKKTYGDKVLKWTSSKKSVATVNSKGKITAKKKGTATITLKMKSGAKATCKVKVK